MGFEVSRIDYHGPLLAMLYGQPRHHLGEDPFIAPSFQAVVERLVWVVFLESIPPT